MRKNVRTSTLKKHLGASVRLSESDRLFLHDLTKVGIIDNETADKYHYGDIKMAAKDRLDKLCESGLLERTIVYQKGRAPVRAFTFKSRKVAHLFGGEKLELGGRRQAHHELILSKIYFEEGRPDSFKVESGFSKTEKEFFKVNSIGKTNSCLPDAIYYDDSGEMVLVEADSGQYRGNQIKEKQTAWKGLKQVWGQPVVASSKIVSDKVYRFE